MYIAGELHTDFQIKISKAPLAEMMSFIKWISHIVCFKLNIGHFINTCSFKWLLLLYVADVVLLFYFYSLLPKNIIGSKNLNLRSKSNLSPPIGPHTHTQINPIVKWQIHILLVLFVLNKLVHGKQNGANPDMVTHQTCDRAVAFTKVTLKIKKHRELCQFQVKVWPQTLCLLLFSESAHLCAAPISCMALFFF